MHNTQWAVLWTVTLLSFCFDLLQLLFQETNPGVRYEYTISKDILVDSNNGTGSYFQWIYGAWTECSATCGSGKTFFTVLLSLVYLHPGPNHCFCFTLPILLGSLMFVWSKSVSLAGISFKNCVIQQDMNFIENRFQTSWWYLLASNVMKNISSQADLNILSNKTSILLLDRSWYLLKRLILYPNHTWHDKTTSKKNIVRLGNSFIHYFSY